MSASSAGAQEPAKAAAGNIPLHFQPAKPSAANTFLVAVDGECEGATGVVELGFNLWLNTVFIPSELARPGYNRAWSLRTVLRLTKRVPEAGDRGKFLAVYEIQTDNIADALPARSKRVADAANNPALKCMKERSVVPYKIVTEVMTKANTVPAPCGNKATAPFPEPPPPLGTQRHLLAVETNLKDKSQAAVFNIWYNEVHIPDVLTSHGYRGVVRLERVGPEIPGRAEALTFYEIHTHDFAKATEIRDARRLRELVIGAYSTGGQYVGPWAQAYYEPMGEVMTRKKP